MRHYEIIANGCLPLFFDIKSKPSLTMSNYPVDLQNEANSLFYSYNSNAINFQKFITEYSTLRAKFLNWLFTKGTTKTYLSYLISTSLLK